MSFAKYPKGDHDDSHHNTRRRKRKFAGNQFVDQAGDKKYESAEDDNLKGTPFEEIPKNPNISYQIIDFFTVFTTLTSFMVCGTCKSEVTFGETSLRGLGFKIFVKCRCGKCFIDSGPMIGNSYEINRRFILIMR